MLSIECPHCEEENFFEYEDIPDRAADDVEVECSDCGKSFKVGWFAELEHR